MQFAFFQIGAKDVDKLSMFYQKVCDFVPVDDNSWLQGKEGVCLKAPGFSDDKQIILGIIKADKGSVRNINDRGFAHLCFETNDVKSALKRLVKYGGSFQSTMKNPYGNPCVYCKDIEGNVVEFHIPFLPPKKHLGDYFTTIGCLLGLKHDSNIVKEKVPSSIKFIHVNIITEDWRKLCDFYNDVTGSSDTGNIKDHSGKFKEGVIGVDGVHVIGKHILLPNFYNSYPTLEIFTYSIKGKDKPAELDELGINCIGFKTNDLEKDILKFEKYGGKLVKRLSDNQVLIHDLQNGYILLTK